MTAVSRRFWTVGATLLVITVFLARLTAQQSSSCTCKDIPFLLNVLSRDHATLDKIQELRLKVPTTARTTDPVPGSAPRISYAQLINSELAQALALGTNAQVPNGTCVEIRDMRVPGEPSASNLIGQWDDSSKFQLEEVLRVLNAMPSSCRLGDWFGSITVSETILESGAQHIPAKNDYEAQWDKGGDESFKRTLTRKGTIWVSGTFEQPVSNWQAGETITKNSVHHHLVACEQGKPATIGRTGSSHEEFNQSGSAYKVGEVDLSVNEDRNTLSLTLSLPEIEISGPYDKTESIAGGCPNDRPDPDEHMSMKDSISKLQVEAKVPISQGTPLKASGSQTIPFPTSSPTMTHTVSLTFHLYKLR